MLRERDTPGGSRRSGRVCQVWTCANAIMSLCMYVASVHQGLHARSEAL